MDVRLVKFAYPIEVLLKAIRTPPTAATAAESANAYSLTPATFTPRAAAARSLVRTAMRRRPVAERRRFATISPMTTKTTRLKTPQRHGLRMLLMYQPKSAGRGTWVPPSPPV